MITRLRPFLRRASIEPALDRFTPEGRLSGQYIGFATGEGSPIAGKLATKLATKLVGKFADFPKVSWKGASATGGNSRYLQRVVARELPETGLWGKLH